MDPPSAPATGPGSNTTYRFFHVLLALAATVLPASAQTSRYPDHILDDFATASLPWQPETADVSIERGWMVLKAGEQAGLVMLRKALDPDWRFSFTVEIEVASLAGPDAGIGLAWPGVAWRPVRI